MKLSDEVKENEPHEEWKGVLHIYKLSTTFYWHEAMSMLIMALSGKFLTNLVSVF